MTHVRAAKQQRMQNQRSMLHEYEQR